MDVRVKRRATPPRHTRPRRWPWYLAGALAVPALILSAAAGYYYVTFSRVIDERLHGERERVLPRIFARPLELRRGETLTERQLIERLNDLGYTQRARAEQPGEFALGRGTVTLLPRGGDLRGKTVRLVFRNKAVESATTRPSRTETRLNRIDRLEVGATGRDRVLLEAPLLTALTSRREKRRQVPLAAIPRRVIQAVLAIEDRRFHEHPGVDVIASIGALITNIRGNKPYLVGGSTITQQIVRNFFLTPEKTLTRKLLEQFMALVLERRATKDEILELYLNEVYLGQRGSFAIHGVAEAARLFFGKDVSNVSVSEAATIAGTIQAPPRLSPFYAPARARERRNVVLQAMVDAGYLAKEAADRAAQEPLTVVARALEAEAPYFVDVVGQTLADRYASITASVQGVDVYTTLDLHLQRLAQDAVRDGLTRVDELIAARRRRRSPAQGALIAVDPRTGDVLALVGGRSYNQSQYNRAVSAHRQPGSVFKPFVYLAAFERAAEEGRTDLTPAMLVDDEPTTFQFEDQTWNPQNYENQYDGVVTLRHALAHSRNVATIKVAEATGYDRVAALWRRIGLGTPPRPYPSIALGVFEATPYEIATAFTLFANGGAVRPLREIDRIVSGSKELAHPPLAAPRSIVQPEIAFLVTNMMRSVLTEGTGAGAHSAGFAMDAAGKTGTTNDLRDAWFVGFTPELLTAVWVGFDDNQPIGLSGAQAALPIWATFMVRALAGHPNLTFRVPEGITFVDIDRDNGKLAVPGCPRVLTEAFVVGTEPTATCELHRY